jgi:hypothetical protein
MSLWRKLNYLVPDPQCRTKEGVITEWTDARPQPTQAEIDAVSMSDVNDKEKADRKEDKAKTDKAMLETIANLTSTPYNDVKALYKTFL